MTYCYTPIDNPAFFYGAGDCATVKHNLTVEAGGLAGGDDLISAILIQLGTDARANGERGWWGDEFQPFPIGNRIWTLNGQPAAGNARADEYIRSALRPLIAKKLIDEIDIRTVRTIDGMEVVLTVKRGGQEIARATLNG